MIGGEKHVMLRSGSKTVKLGVDLDEMLVIVCIERFER